MILVTGAAGVLGQAVVQRLSKNGAVVAAIDFQTTIPPAGQSLSIGGVDLADSQGCSRMLQTLAAQGAHALHGLVNVAGGFVWETNLNWSKNKNKVISLTPDTKEQILSDASVSFLKIVAHEGGAFGDIYGYAYQRDDNGKMTIEEDGLL